MSERDRAERAGHHREYWSPRLPGCVPWGSVGKWLTHRRERAAARREEHRAKIEAEEVKSWKCKSCDTIILEGEFCGPCGRYWEDVRNGLFDYE